MAPHCTTFDSLGRDLYKIATSLAAQHLKYWDFHSCPPTFPPSQIGSFFGTIDSILMRTLVNSSLFTFKKTFDYQSLCDPKKGSQAAAGPRSVYVVSYTSQTGSTFSFLSGKNEWEPTVARVCAFRYLRRTYLLISPAQERSDK